MTDLSEFKNIIIRFPNWLGDCIMAMPFLEVISKHLPDSELSVLIRGKNSELLSDDKRVKDVIICDDNKSVSIFDYFRIASKLKERKYDLGIILPDSFSSALIFYLAGIQNRVGYSAEARFFMLKKGVSQPDRKIHRSLKYLTLLKEIGFEIDLEQTILPNICTDDQSVNRAKELTESLERYVVIAPQTQAPSRRWGQAKYAELAKRINKELNLGIVFVGAPDESEVVEKVAIMSGIKYLNLAGKCSLMESYEIMKNSIAYVGNDSGGAHLAAASGTYTISISGADDPEETAPLKKCGKIIQKKLPCIPCVKNVCPRDDIPNECMQIISVDEVFEAVREVVHE